MIYIQKSGLISGNLFLYFSLNGLFPISLLLFRPFMFILEIISS